MTTGMTNALIYKLHVKARNNCNGTDSIIYSMLPKVGSSRRTNVHTWLDGFMPSIAKVHGSESTIVPSNPKP